MSDGQLMEVQIALFWLFGLQKLKGITHLHFQSPINEWDVSRITDMYLVFYNEDDCTPNTSNWDVSLVTDFVRNNHSVCAFTFKQIDSPSLLYHLSLIPISNKCFMEQKHLTAT